MNAVLRLYAFAAPLARLADVGRPLLLLALRLYLAMVFFKAGLTKIDDWDTTLFLFAEEYSVPLLPPALAAVLGTAGELLLPPLLTVGLAGRFAALGLTVVNAMALLAYPALWAFECPAAVQSHLWWGAGMLVVLAFGPGQLSVDHRIVYRRDTW
jgi:putative oxidoreductase